MKYKVIITETFQRAVAVDADSSTEARSRVHDAWLTGEAMLGDDDFEGVEVFVVGPVDNNEKLFTVERKG